MVLEEGGYEDASLELCLDGGREGGPGFARAGVEAPAAVPFGEEDEGEDPIAAAYIHEPRELRLPLPCPCSLLTLLPAPRKSIHIRPNLHQPCRYPNILENMLPRVRDLDPALTEQLAVLRLQRRVRVLVALLRQDLVEVHALGVASELALAVLVDCLEQPEGGAVEFGG